MSGITAAGEGAYELLIAPCATLLRRAARWLLRFFGWRIELRWPPVPKAVVIFYPHTSNWDFAIVSIVLLVPKGKLRDEIHG